MLKRSFFRMFRVFAVSVLLISCQQPPPTFECADQIGCVTIAPDEPIKIGVLQALSGGTAPIGRTQVRSIELALAQRDHLVLGHPIEVYTEDARCTSEGGNMAALKLVADPQMVALLGTTCSASGVAASKVMSEAGLVMISGSNTAPSLTSVAEQPGDAWQPGYFRTCCSSVKRGQVAAIFALQHLHIMKAATIIHDGDIYTQAVAHAFEERFIELGGEILLAAVINTGDTDMQPVLTAVAASQAELVFLPMLLSEGILIVQQAKTFDTLDSVIWMGDTALMIAAFLEAVRTDGIGMYFITNTPPESPSGERLLAEYQRKYAVPPQHRVAYATAYDAANLLLQTIEHVAIHEEDGTVHIGRQALREALYDTTEFDGVSGSLTCDEFGDCGSCGVNVYRLDDPAQGLEGLQSNVIYTYRPSP